MLNALQLATLLGVRVPGIKRTIETTDNVYIVMERIHGQTVEEAWIGMVLVGMYPVYFEHASMQNFDVPLS